MRSKGIFITGTDTGIGKTWFTTSLMQALKGQGRKVAGMKPIASGASLIDGNLINEDANLIMQHCSEPIAYELVNPAVFELPVAPSIASQITNKPIDLSHIRACYDKLAVNSENIAVEGVGGWRVPFSEQFSTSELVRELDLPVILVVGLRLGCINHAILTAESIRADGVKLCGWVSNQVEIDYLHKEETVALLNRRLECTNIADLGYMDKFNPDKMAEKIDRSFLC